MGEPGREAKTRVADFAKEGKVVGDAKMLAKWGDEVASACAVQMSKRLKMTRLPDRNPVDGVENRLRELGCEYAERYADDIALGLKCHPQTAFQASVVLQDLREKNMLSKALADQLQAYQYAVNQNAEEDAVASAALQEANCPY